MSEERARELLERERRRLERTLAGAGEREDSSELSHLDQHPADYATELFDRELDEGTIEHVREELDAVDRAFKRLEEGTYGRSVESGEPIPDARLELIPWAERTADEQARYERV